MRRIAMLAVLAAGCGGAARGIDAKLPSHIADAPLVLIELESGGVTDWQKERDEAIVDRVEACLPSALAPLCEGACEVRQAEGGEAGSHLVLVVRTAYIASAHFLHGFRLEVEYEIVDATRSERLALFRYRDEPLTKVMAEEDADPDEVLTFDSAATADRLCEDVALEAAELSRGP
jgi:hypothetical protein